MSWHRAGARGTSLTLTSEMRRLRSVKGVARLAKSISAVGLRFGRDRPLSGSLRQPHVSEPAAGTNFADAGAMRFVPVEEARAAGGLRIVIAGGVPSPWSQAALGIFDMKRLDYLAARFRTGAEQVREWTGAHNVPVVVYENEPPRTGWAEILELAERLEDEPRLVPSEDALRVRMFGLAHELMGPTGLAASVRLMLVHTSLVSDGREGWPLVLANYLGTKYGYAPERAAAVKARALRVLSLMRAELEASLARGCKYVLGREPTALDVYLAVCVGIIALFEHEQAPMLAPVRHAFQTLDPEVRAALPGSLREHRDMMYADHLPLPMRL